MTKLPLDDPRWMELKARGAMTIVMRNMTHLMENPGDYDAFFDFWPYLCSENTTWSSAYAVAPYLMEFVKYAPEEKQFEYAMIVGTMEAYVYEPAPKYLQEGWEQAKAEARAILQKSLWQPMDAVNGRYFLAAIAALKGYPGLADAMEALDACEECSTRIEG